MPQQAIGISIHTGWAACVVVSGSPTKPEIVANEVVRVLDDSERFCFHRAAEMKRADAEKWLARVRDKALQNARAGLSRLPRDQVRVCAIVAKPGDPGDLEHVLSAHPRIHTAEGCFYRDVFRDACSVPVQLVPPKSLDPSGLGKPATRPWGRDQRLATLAALRTLGNHAAGGSDKRGSRGKPRAKRPS